ncbi:MAG: hypothetical protein CVU44_10085 [Chloroflexi bacterium HGW-Chloroflexi-6]|nr:MAG: hypothetical protein CVU44_10085 [Chloroflexi bacterium HGW-Chloroflexi-6]
MSRRDVLPVRQMLDYAREALTISQDRQRADLDNDRLLDLALTRLLEIIGEAANRVPEEIQEAHPEIAWGQIISLRNRLIHGYDSIDFDILWAIVKNDLPELIKNLEKIA